MIKFSDTTTKRGLVQLYEKEIGANYGDVSGNSELLAEFTARVNNAIDNYLLIWASSAGTWQADDTNQTKYPIITFNLVAGQRDYAFTTDADANNITAISKVLILPSATATQYIPIEPIDELTNYSNNILLNTNQGTPYQYGKLANGIFLDSIPNYSVDNGMKMVVEREGFAFTTADTTRTPGVPVYHEYFYLKPAFEMAGIKGLSNLNNLEKKVIDLEGSERLGVTGKIKEFFSKREKDTRPIMSMKKILYI